MVDSIVSQLGRVELFSALDRGDLEAVAELAQRKRYSNGDLVFKQGEVGRRYYIVESGELRVLHVDPTGIESEVDRFSPGDFFGESSLLLGEPHDATVEAAEDSVLLTIDKEDFDQLVVEHPSILKNLQISPEVERRRHAPRFAWQEPDEVVVFVRHKHNVILIRKLILPSLALFFILASFFFLGAGSIIVLVFGGLLAAVPLLFSLYQIVDHFNDNYILTNKRVIHDEHVYLIHRSRVGAPLGNIQSIQEVQEGMLAQYFNYGDLLIETAGEPGGLVAFRQVSDPTAVQQIIFEQRDRLEAQARAEERAAIQEALQYRLNRGGTRELETGTEKKERVEEDGQVNLSSWLMAPLRVVRYFFPALRYQEGDTITWRKHWIALLGPIARPTALIALATLIVALLLRTDMDQLSILLSYGIVLTFFIPWWLWVFEDWQNDVYQITSSRIVDVEQLPLGLREERREAGLGMIQNVSLTVPGVVGRVLGYGSVTIETAGAGAFTFDYVKNPEAVQTEIFRRIEIFETRERQKKARQRRDELLDWFTVYDEMRHPEAEPGAGSVLPRASS